MCSSLLVFIAASQANVVSGLGRLADNHAPGDEAPGACGPARTRGVAISLKGKQERQN